jgi:cytochrome c peroxidase
VCHNEFRVAGAGSGSDPWFELETARFPWLHQLGVSAGVVSPLELRGALLQFLYGFSHSPNPHAQSRSELSPLQAEGARAFERHCASCHAPRLLSDDAASALPAADWPRYVLARNAPIVWARSDYAKTGIEPYVHERGTRIPSLRRLALKPRYFTNGSSPTLAHVLARFREAPAVSLHAASGEQQATALSEASQRALLAFLELL